MTILETNEFMKRIKSHYQEFVIDEFKQSEWYKELKKYDYEDVNKKFEEHLKSEIYGEHIPKLYFLTKYLIPSNKKGEIKEYTVYCQICNRAVDYKEYDLHYGRCSSIAYIKKQMKKLFNKDLVDEEQLYKIPLEDFNKRYDQFLHQIIDKPTSKAEMKIIFKILYPETPELTIQDMIKDYFTED